MLVITHLALRRLSLLKSWELDVSNQVALIEFLMPFGWFLASASSDKQSSCRQVCELKEILADGIENIIIAMSTSLGGKRALGPIAVIAWNTLDQHSGTTNQEYESW